MSQRQPTISEVKIQYYEGRASSENLVKMIFNSYENQIVELANKNQQLEADLVKLKVQQSKEPEPKEVKKK